MAASPKQTISYRLDLLRQKGDERHNKQVILEGSGVLYIARRHHTMEGFNIKDMTTCDECHFWLHTSSNISENRKHCIVNKHTERKGGSIHRQKVQTIKQPKNAEELKSSLKHTLKDDEIG